VLVVGTGTASVTGVTGAAELWLAEAGVDAGALAGALAPVLAEVRVVILPASPDGRDLAPRLALKMGRPLLAGAVKVDLLDDHTVEAELLRVDGRTVVPVVCEGPVVATLMPGARSPGQPGNEVSANTISLPVGGRDIDDVPTELIAPDPATMDLADAKRVLGGGAGLVPAGLNDEEATALFELLVAVAGAVGASAGATRVVTDAGWMPYDRQIGTTGVTVDPDVYVALGVSGASQHVGGLGAPRRTASVNIDPSCPMTAMADLGVVADAPSVLLELAVLLGVEVPAEICSRLSSLKDPNLA
jgi:electron transfer flavoprotein alpha subunit